MKKFPRKSLPLFVAIIISGCASKHIQIEIKPEPLVSIKVPECDETQRNLTVPWALRKYWCAITERKEDLQQHNDSVLNSKVIYTPEVIEEINEEAEKPDYTPIVNKPIAVSRHEPVGSNVVSVEFTSTVTTSPEATNTATKESIIFASNLISLGPQGRHATEALISKAKNSDSVKLRGLILPEEVLVDSAIYREKLSVGRALAVRDYWEENGVDISHVTILHHNPNASGRVVEVRFNG